MTGERLEPVCVCVVRNGVVLSRLRAYEKCQGRLPQAAALNGQASVACLGIELTPARSSIECMQIQYAECVRTL